MTRTGISRRAAVTVAFIGAVLAAPTGAVAVTTHSATATDPPPPALTTHSATTSTPNSSGQLVATAKCGAGEHVVSGGFKTPHPKAAAGAVVSRAVNGDRWTVHLYEFSSDTLTTYAYCGSKGKVTSHQNTVTAMTGFANTTATESCPAGQALVSGGYAINPSSGESNSPIYRNYAASGAWTVMGVAERTPANLAAFGYCQRSVVVKVRSSSSGSIPEDSTGSATASCHTAETLLAGGYTTTPTPDYENKTGPDLFYGGSHRSGARSWTASAYNWSMASGKITAFAYCET